MKIAIQSLDVQKETPKENVLEKMSHSLYTNDIIEDPTFFYTEIMEREKVGNTHIGLGAALVHSIAQTVKQEGIYLYYLSHPLNQWYWNETHPIKLIILYAIQNIDSENFPVFKKFSLMCADDELLQKLINQHYSAEALEELLTK